jgi:hypothetical protein
MKRALAILTLSGAGAIVLGSYLRFGLIGALIVYGAFAIAAGLLIDDGSKASG